MAVTTLPSRHKNSIILSTTCSTNPLFQLFQRWQDFKCRRLWKEQNNWISMEKFLFKPQNKKGKNIVSSWVHCAPKSLTQTSWEIPVCLIFSSKVKGLAELVWSSRNRCITKINLRKRVLQGSRTRLGSEN